MLLDAIDSKTWAIYKLSHQEFKNEEIVKDIKANWESIKIEKKIDTQKKEALKRYLDLLKQDKGTTSLVNKLFYEVTLEKLTNHTLDFESILSLSILDEDLNENKITVRDKTYKTMFWVEHKFRVYCLSVNPTFFIFIGMDYSDINFFETKFLKPMDYSLMPIEIKDFRNFIGNVLGQFDDSKVYRLKIYVEKERGSIASMDFPSNLLETQSEINLEETEIFTSNLEDIKIVKFKTHSASLQVRDVYELISCSFSIKRIQNIKTGNFYELRCRIFKTVEERAKLLFVLKILRAVYMEVVPNETY